MLLLGLCYVCELIICLFFPCNFAIKSERLRLNKKKKKKTRYYKTTRHAILFMERDHVRGAGGRGTVGSTRFLPRASIKNVTNIRSVCLDRTGSARFAWGKTVTRLVADLYAAELWEKARYANVRFRKKKKSLIIGDVPLYIFHTNFFYYHINNNRRIPRKNASGLFFFFETIYCNFFFFFYNNFLTIYAFVYLF